MNSCVASHSAFVFNTGAGGGVAVRAVANTAMRMRPAHSNTGPAEKRWGCETLMQRLGAKRGKTEGQTFYLHREAVSTRSERVPRGPLSFALALNSCGAALLASEAAAALILQIIPACQ